ncbi:2-dehydro-3-deoxyphosphogluconate aldolase / (4S)-4-hydroxy-2-oxoglutarate aldolase [Actinokineospora alba]|uniref:2-dehydro-3-deoxyphosphogluconate aldolase / (4S)-4-hydroxy-2-oxoglutarate aldolase n=1 Tax=Actinokineospora alba TaxID=504798 RepID=A0A1H0EWP9_9PSEU|nr:bifunctional 4-hydroxy-2-oxoglutarate aldolase/2-dehydro-3-deoxy-phosphogluconate aldolase [Actinokineospora alba]TDP69251.1 2-dehydro-3-deoxyphosphogluconate aldolase/(4S)-4-hydroxy-2-oxoglutarate aldolase [Actinokineospora alba]SDI20966.1 2-dehydro-3-deoxyphosphogluconate aldolase / (4S)-4-hydroxy-2-oxoglutarate aldolase [Actinokineospora alba]SDN86736.1 2-dehydro-3-deoxyphosphogluconate aldolase / (4S)-4-hydroxy-2-oxoglutarate aldolase [Actinokineospora alba]
MRLDTALDATPVIAILRASSAKHLIAVAETLRAAGIRAVEFTLTTPGVYEALAGFKADGIALGAGTVTTRQEARRAVEAGAGYLISPAVCLDVIAEARTLGVPVLPGAYTPTEVLTAWQAGAGLVKLFPAATGGVAHLKAIRAPLPAIGLVPTGGIGLDDAADYLDAGARAVGIGAPLIGDACETGDLDALRARADALIDRIRR